ncbi:MAG: helix-turn-helix domain-containing protein, partial [Clostridia bacterium]|nr:helix-turn-helix domain-containing protein [Clostridia bacterium]
ELRKSRNWTQLELAEKLNVTDKAVSKWEQGAGLPDFVNIIELSNVFGVTTDYIMKGETPTPTYGNVTNNEENVAEEEIVGMKVGEFIEARTHAQFLNQLLDKNYSGYMKCGYGFNATDLIWMIRLDGQFTSTGWCNTLEDNGNKIIENFVGSPEQRLEPHKKSVVYQKRYVFDIIDRGYGRRKYVFRGAFIFNREEGNNDYRVWKKVEDAVDFMALDKNKLSY